MTCSSKRKHGGYCSFGDVYTDLNADTVLYILTSFIPRRSDCIVEMGTAGQRLWGAKGKMGRVSGV